MTDEAYRAYLKEQLAGYSAAGSKRAYEYIARKANERIIDVCVTSPDAGEIVLYALYDGGYPAIAPSGIKSQILAACSSDTVRPLTDTVSVDDPVETTYYIELTYYVRSDVTKSASEITTAMSEAIAAYRQWQDSKLGRDLNPSKLTQFLMDTGLVARVAITTPVYTAINDGSDGNAPGHTKCTGSSITNGGVVDA